MYLARFPRRRYSEGPTPLQRMKHLTRYLEGPDIYVKRDDLLGLAAGGNKTRKLEFLVAEAISRGADTLITAGAVQSNHCRLTLAAAVMEGMRCRLVLEERLPGSYSEQASGNNLLFDLLGAEAIQVVEAGTDLNATMSAVAEDLRRENRTGYVIPVGGSNPLGTLGYVACAQEILAQCFDRGLCVDHIICASGSGGTQAGLLVGLEGNHANIRLTGISVSRTRDRQEDLVSQLASATAGLVGAATPLRQRVRALDEWVGPGYSLPSAETVEAVRLAARLDGILLDPVYTGKAMAGLIGLIRKGELGKGESVLFVHTGGSPMLYVNQDVLSRSV